MKKFIVQASELVYYEIEIQAHDISEAMQKIDRGDYELPAPCDGSDFQLLAIGFIDEV